MPPASPSAPSARWLAPIILLLGGLCFSLIWVLLALYLGRQSGWMALLAAVDAALLLRFAGVRPGGRRALVAALATVAMVLLVNWFIIASHLFSCWACCPGNRRCGWGSPMPGPWPGSPTARWIGRACWRRPCWRPGWRSSIRRILPAGAARMSLAGSGWAPRSITASPS